MTADAAPPGLSHLPLLEGAARFSSPLAGEGGRRPDEEEVRRVFGALPTSPAPRDLLPKGEDGELTQGSKMDHSDGTSGWEFVHGTAIVVREHGLLFRGPSGSGKSRLAECLLAEAERRHWFARLVGDDRVGLAARYGRVLVRGHPTINGLIERRTQGLVPLPFEPAVVLSLVIDFAAPHSLPRHPERPAEATSLLGITLPLVAIEADPAERACRIIFGAMR